MQTIAIITLESSAKNFPSESIEWLYCQTIKPSLILIISDNIRSVDNILLCKKESQRTDIPIHSVTTSHSLVSTVQQHQPSFIFLQTDAIYAETTCLEHFVRKYKTIAQSNFVNNHSYLLLPIVKAKLLAPSSNANDFIHPIEEIKNDRIRHDKISKLSSFFEAKSFLSFFANNKITLSTFDNFPLQLISDFQEQNSLQKMEVSRSVVLTPRDGAKKLPQTPDPRPQTPDPRQYRPNFFFEVSE